MKKGIGMIVLIMLLMWGFIWSSENYEDLNIFSEVYSYVKKNYVDPQKTGSKELIQGAINGMLQTLNDPFTRFMTKEASKEMETEISGSFGGLGIIITIKNEKLVVVSPIEDTPAYKIGIKSDDWITHIEGTSTEGITLQEAVKKLRGPKDTKVTITVTRKGEPNPITYIITRDIIKIKTVKAEMIDKQIWYIRITGFNNNTVSELDEHLKQILSSPVEYIILDIRNNGGGTLQASVGVANRFFPKGALLVYTQGKDKTTQARYLVEDSGLKVNSKIILLINGGTASGAEILAGAIKDHKRGILLGKKTFGKASVQTVYNLSDGSGLVLTTAYYYTPSGTLIHNKGVEPDIVVEEEVLSEDKRKLIEKFIDSELTEDFLKNRPEYTDKDIDEFIANIKKQGFDIEKRYILRDIEETLRKLKQEKPSIIDRLCDTQLIRAIEIIKASQFLR